MMKRRRHASSRISWLATNASNGIGASLVQMPPGERKSGMPHSVEMPAPVNGTIVSEIAIRSPSLSMAVLRSGAIMYAQAVIFARWSHAISAHHAARAQSRRRARLLLQQARAEGGPPPRGREGPLHAGLPRGLRG